jgi:hypothetical protein
MTRRARRPDPARLLPPVTDWRTTDADEILNRQLRAREERPRIVNLAPAHPVFSDFAVHSSSGLDYRVEIRDIANRQFSCTCTDFRINGLGTCKHVEAVLLHLARRHRSEFNAARRGEPSPRIDLVPDRAAGRLRIECNLAQLPPCLRARFDVAGLQLPDLDPADLVGELAAASLPQLRVSLDTTAWLAADLADEAFPALCEATLAHAQAAEMTRQRPEPATLAEVLRPPYDAAWPADTRSAIEALNANAISAQTAIVLVEWLLQA